MPLDLTKIRPLESMERLVISQSFLNEAEQCFGRFFFRSAVELKLIEPVPQHTYPGTIFGTAFHRVMEELALAHFAEKLTMRAAASFALTKIMAYFAEEEEIQRAAGVTIREGEGHKEGDARRLLTMNGPQLASTGAVTFIRDVFEPVWPEKILPEHEIGYVWPHLPLAPKPIFLRGTLDLTVIYPVEVGIVFDYKSSSRAKKFQKHRRDDDVQSQVYTKLFEVEFGFKPKKFIYKVIDTLNNAIISETYPPYEFPTEINNRINGLLGKFSAENPAKFFITSTLCHFCEFKHLCPRYPEVPPRRSTK